MVVGSVRNVGLEKMCSMVVVQCAQSLEIAAVSCQMQCLLVCAICQWFEKMYYLASFQCQLFSVPKVILLH
jgi:hypothetical protein